MSRLLSWTASWDSDRFAEPIVVGILVLALVGDVIATYLYLT